MKAILVQQLCSEHIIPSLPGYTVNKDLLYNSNIDYLLRGFSFESSAFSKNQFTIYTFLQPLFVPSNYLFFNFSKRLGILSTGRDIWWEYDKLTETQLASEILLLIRNFGLAFLDKGKTLCRFIAEFNKPEYLDNKHIAEEIGYSCILVDKYRESKCLLNDLHGELVDDIRKHPEITWMANLDNRVVSMLNLLKMEEYRKAKHQLLEWRQYTLSKLKLIGNIIEA